MKIKVRFISFFTFGLILFLLYITLIIVLLLEVFLPWAGIADNAPAFAMVFATAFVSGGGLFSFWFVRPILSMMAVVNAISAGSYHQLEMLDKTKRRNGKLRKRYWLYKELITDIESLAEQLMQAEIEREKLEQAKQDWVRGISHDIKTPLSYVVGYSSLLLSTDHDWTVEEQQTFLLQIQEKGKYIESLINNLNLSFRLEDNTKPLPLQISSFNLIAFMEKLVADMLNQQSKIEYAISIEVLDSCLNIEADEQLLYRAVTNLINNAMRHNPAGTEIKMAIRRNRQEGVSILLSDNGTGMPPEVLDTLFVKYHDNDNAIKGKRDYIGGLGLSIVKSIIDAHNGEILVESKVNEGTTFIIHLPLEQ